MIVGVGRTACMEAVSDSARSSAPAGGLPRVRLLHTSDIHIADGADPAWALRGVLDLAIEHDVDLVLIAGDLFDHARIAEDTARCAIAELARLDRPVVVIPGNHDCVDERSVYRRVDLQDAGPHVHFAGDPQGEELRFDALRLHVWARGIENHHPGHRPLAGRRPAGPGEWSVVVTHGHYVENWEDSDRSSQIRQEEIAALGCDYLALGHWHRFLDVSQGGVTAFYCGSPSESGTDAGTVNLVILDPETGVGVERVPIGVGPSARP